MSRSDIIGFETRYLRLQSSDKANVNDSNTNFTVNFGNEATTNFSNRVYGISVDTITFPNFIPNVPLLTTIRFDQVGSPPPSFIIPIDGGVVTLENFIVQIQNAMPSGIFGTVFTQYVPTPGDSNLFNLTMTLTGPDITVYNDFGENELPFYMGIVFPNGVVNRTFTAGTYNFRTNLYGLSEVFLHSDRLTAGRIGLDAVGPNDTHGVTMRVVAAIPITTCPGQLQIYEDHASTNRPSIVYGGAQDIDISVVDIALRDQYRRPIDLGTGELLVVLRVWLRNV